MPTIIAYGDSNTYGYNPATGGKYPDGSWCDHLHALTGWRVFNLGACGREIPHGYFEVSSTVSQLVSLISSKGADNQTTLYIMLGSNDLLDGYTADETGQRMKAFIKVLQNKNPSDLICLIAPVKMKRGTWVGSDRLIEESEKLQDVYEELADKYGIDFISTAGWDIPLAFDGVHFTPEGHRIFAEKLSVHHLPIHKVQ